MTKDFVDDALNIALAGAAVYYGPGLIRDGIVNGAAEAYRAFERFAMADD